MRDLSVRLCLGFLILGIAGCTTIKKPPNIVFILIDDLGIEATNSYGSKGLVRENGDLVPYRQPNLEAIAAAGMTFQNAFATPSCAPTRAQFLTGRYPFRTRVTYPTLPNGPLADNEITLARILQQQGYHTGMAGKWNLRFGTAARRSTPAQRQEVAQHVRKHGFAESHAFVGHTIDYGRADPEAEYEPFRINQWACEFVERAARKEHPFFLQYSLGLVHFPFVPTPGGIAEASLGPNAGRRERTELHYLNMIEYADRLVGRLVKQIDDLGIASNTVVIVAGDNGTNASFTSRYRNQDVRGGKLGLLDTGSQVPFHVRWPGVVKAGSEYSGLTDFSDIFATVIELAGAELPTDRTIDGRSFARQLAGATAPHREFVYCQVRDQAFVRDTQYKLVLQDSRGLRAGLYDVSDSPFRETRIPEADQTQSQAERRRRLLAHDRKLLPGPPGK